MQKRLALALLVVAGVACGKSKSSHDLFGTEVKPPKGLDVLRPGMTQAEAMAAVPGLQKDGGQLELPSGDPDIHLYMPGNPISQISAHVPMERRTDLEKWGPEASPDHYRGKTWVAEIHRAVRSFEIDFTPKIDMKTMFGGGPASLPAPLAKVKPGMTKRELDTVVPVLVVKFGALPDEGTHVGFPNADKPTGLTQVTMTLHPEHRDELFALWGPGTVGTADGHEIHTWSAPTGWKATLSLANKGETSLGQPSVDSLVYDAATVP